MSISRRTPGSRASARSEGIVSSFGREGVLRQVDGADAEEVHVLGEMSDLESGGGDLPP